MSDNNSDLNLGPPSRHRADDDLEALASGAFAPGPVPPLPTQPTASTSTTTPATSRTPNGDADLFDHTDIVADALTAAALAGAIVWGTYHAGSSLLDDDDEGVLGLGNGAIIDSDDEEDVDENEPLEMDYGSDDDVSVEDEGVGDVAELSKRTSDLIDSFRDYVDTMGSEEDDDSSSPKEGGGDVEEGHLFKDTPLIIKGDFNYYSNGLLKDYSIEEEDDDDLAQEHGSLRNLVRYRYAWLRSRRVKRGICMIALASVLIGIISGV
eukprot:CAMPEP_0202001776 /NCGR_PEP_ID=MMETSP0905-20130828/7793_1 /ASSEMBLY_ACC=CAM_ASM_000554 /TAXON_ID=420261 /ORGANISM="Thalassiosira antarctica, Strain CCMP982" /LENGTH=265 /DNA_ID=CAMNT_0048558545 /DNA_START=276 /DNA_END=1070 /DNA_ORIENTATION=-